MTYVRESKVEQHFVDCAAAHRWAVRKLEWPGRPGAPDRFVMKAPGRLWFVELKTKGGVLRPEQVREHELLERLGFNIAVLWTKQQVEDFFRDLD